MTSPADRSESVSRSGRTSTHCLIELFALSALAFSAPLFGVLAEGPEFFVNLRATRGDIILLAVVVATLVPVTLWMLEMFVRLLSRPLGGLLHQLFLFLLLVGCVAPALSRHAALPGSIALVSAVVAALGFVAAYRLQTWPRRLLSFLSPLALVAPLFFLLSPGVFSLLFPKARDSYVRDAGDKSATPVVLVIFDEFPVNVLLDKNLKVDAARFPNFASFAEQSYWFKNATSINQFTPLAVPAILSGKFPASSRQLPTVEAYPINIFTRLAGTHAMSVYEPFTRLCPNELCQRAPEEAQPRSVRLKTMASDISAILMNLLVPRDIGIKVPDIDGKWGDFWGEDEQEWEPPNFSRDGRVREFQNYINSLRESRDPTLYFAHVVLPHMPYQFMPSGRSYKKSGPRAYLDNRWMDEPELIELSYQQFLLQVGTADTLFGNLVRKLKEIGVYDRALIVLAADHGVSFQVGTYRRGHPHHPSFYEDILKIPLFVKLPFQTSPVVAEQNVETIDILPTILDVLKLRPLEETEGVSAFSAAAAKRTEKKFLVGRIPEGKTRTSDHVADWGKDMAGTAVEVDIPGEFPRSTLDWKLSLPGYQSPNPVNPFFIGPHSDLLGKAVSQFSIGESVAGSLKFFDKRGPTDRNGNVNFKKNSSQCPCSFSGSLNGSQFRVGDELALAVNGTLQSFAKVMQDREKGERHFSMFVSDAAYRDGENKVEFFLLRSQGSELQFLPLRIE
ncbi:MAG: sulfatase-like hydrolase/transferase [Deltaproteobacteria bacterium]|nr:sulfatase-like hydrolase/transferase [Deltaproteobacteria bacterium]